MKPTDEEITLEPDTEIPDEVADVQEVAEKLPAYQEFIREQKLNEV
jgi:hypothetical protein